MMKKPATMMGVPPVGPAIAVAAPAILPVAAAVLPPPPQQPQPDNLLPKNIIQARELLYRLIISQLFYDGYQQVAVNLSNLGK